jgi:hypothetical protein
MYFRLMAAIIDLPVTPTSESIIKCLIVLPCLNNICTRRKFGYITFESRHPIYIRSDGRHFEFLWAWLEIFRYLGQQKNHSCNSLLIGGNRMEKSQSIQKIQGVQLLHPRRLRVQ